MNLTDYQTRKSNEKSFYCRSYVTGDECEVVDIEDSRQLEREAAAWKDVAEMFSKCLIIEDAQSINTREAFDALKSQLTQP